MEFPPVEDEPHLGGGSRGHATRGRFGLSYAISVCGGAMSTASLVRGDGMPWELGQHLRPRPVPLRHRFRPGSRRRHSSGTSERMRTAPSTRPTPAPSRPAARTRSRLRRGGSARRANVNSKIHIMNTYATSYTASERHEFLYFGLERNANTGNADVAFWFLQSDNAGCDNAGGTDLVHRRATSTATCSSSPRSPTEAASAHQRLPVGRRRQRYPEPDPHGPTPRRRLQVHRRRRLHQRHHQDDPNPVADRQQAGRSRSQLPHLGILRGRRRPHGGRARR